MGEYTEDSSSPLHFWLLYVMWLKLKIPRLSLSRRCRQQELPNTSSQPWKKGDVKKKKQARVTFGHCLSNRVGYKNISFLFLSLPWMHFVSSAGFPLPSDSSANVFPAKQHIKLLLVVTFLKIPHKPCISHQKEIEKTLRLESSVCCRGERFSPNVSYSWPCSFAFPTCIY